MKASDKKQKEAKNASDKVNKHNVSTMFLGHIRPRCLSIHVVFSYM